MSEAYRTLREYIKLLATKHHKTEEQAKETKAARLFEDYEREREKGLKGEHERF